MGPEKKVNLSHAMDIHGQLSEHVFFEVLLWTYLEYLSRQHESSGLLLMPHSLTGPIGML